MGLRLKCLVLCASVVVTPALADCTCECINGRSQALCEHSYDVKPACIMTCPTMPTASSYPPVSVPTVPPPGASSCGPARICDMFANCRWQTVCR